jgi:exopolysaccharide production protein ExoZ
MTFYLLQWLRFLAALMVLLFHLHLYPSGYKGVDIFFVISGFVMYYTLLYRDRPTALKFIINRVTKIFFLYWVALAFLFIIMPFKLDTDSFQSFLLVPGHRSLLGVSWSLSYELYFYFVVGIAVYLLRPLILKNLYLSGLLISTAIVLLNLTAYTTKGSIINFLIGNNFWEFLLGIGAGYLALAYQRAFSNTLILIMGLLSLIAFLLTTIPYADVASYVIYGPLSFLVVYFFARYEKERGMHSKMAAVFSLLGDASYGIYLFGPVITLLIPRDILFFEGVVIFLTIGLSILINQKIENPFLQFARRWFYEKLNGKKGSSLRL